LASLTDAGVQGTAPGRAPPHGAATVAEVLRELPVATLLLDERGALRPLVNVYVDGEDVRERDGLDTQLDGSEEIRVIAAIAGG